MSQPLLFVDPSDNQIKKVVESEVVTLDEIDTRIAHHQSEINRLNTERVKFLDLQGAQASTPVDSQPVADQGSVTAANSGSAEATAPTGDATSAPADPAPAAPVDTPAAPVDAAGTATPPISA